MIRLTKLTDYGIVLMSHLALHGDRRWNAADLSRDTHLPRPMVSKILKLLAREGLLDSTRGVKGGYALGKSASEISVVDIIAALDGPIALTECSDETTAECSYEAICRVKGHWLQINQVVKSALVAISLEQMAMAVPVGSGSSQVAGAGTEQNPLVVLGR